MESVATMGAGRVPDGREATTGASREARGREERRRMRAVVIREHGGLDRLRFEDVPEAAPGPGEVRVRLRASGVNHLDTWVRRGVPGHTFPLPLVPGCDGAGVVDAVGPGVRSRKA